MKIKEFTASIAGGKRYLRIEISITISELRDIAANVQESGLNGKTGQ